MLPNLNGSTLIVAISKILPFCEFSDTKNKDSHIEVLHTQHSFELKILETLAEKLHFKTKFISDSHQQPFHAWGYYDNAAKNSTTKNLRTSFFVQSTLNRKTDIALCDISITEERFALVDFTVPTFYNDIAFISTTNSKSFTSINLIINQPFEKTVWLAIAVTFLALCITLKLLSLSKSNLKLKDLTTGLLAIALKQHFKLSESIKSLKVVTTCLLALWILACLVLSNLYSTVFYSLLTVPHQQLIDTVQDILRVAQTDSHTIVARNNSIFQKRFLEAAPSERLFYAIGQHLNRTKLIATHYSFEFAKANPKHVYITSRMVLIVKRLFYGADQFHIGRDSLGPDISGIILRKGSPLKRPFDQIILQCQEFGLVNYWIQRTVFLFAKQTKRKNFWKIFDDSFLKSSSSKFRQGHHKDSSIQEFKLFDVQSIFIVLLIGLSASVFVFIAETAVA